MKKSLLIRQILTIGILLLCSAAWPAQTTAAEPQRVAVLPFKINAEKDLSFLRNGIFDMLSSRLSEPDKVQVLSRTEVEKVVEKEIGPAETGSIDEAAARRIGGQLKADYVLYGSLTMFGNSLSIDAKMLDVAGRLEALCGIIGSARGMRPGECSGLGAVTRQDGIENGAVLLPHADGNLGPGKHLAHRPAEMRPLLGDRLDDGGIT